jgi:S-adenosyl methyltransferase
VPDGSDQPTNTDEENPFAIDFSVAHPARVQSYLAGGESYFTADRDATEQMAAVLPSGVETARDVLRAVGAFVRRSVRYMAGEAGVRQFLNIGAAPPGRKQVHHVVQETVPDARFVYVSDDPVVLAESHALRGGSPESVIAYVHGTLHDLPTILERAADTLVLAEPVAVLLVTTLNFVPDDSDPHAIVAQLVRAVAPGSHLVVAHPSFDISAEGMPEASARLSQTLNVPWVVRSRDEIARFFDGLDMVEPGLVPIDEWRPTGGNPPPPTGRRVTPIFGGVGRKS